MKCLALRLGILIGSLKKRWILTCFNHKLGGGFNFHPYLGKIPILTNIFRRGWNHQPVNQCETSVNQDFTTFHFLTAWDPNLNLNLATGIESWVEEDPIDPILRAPKMLQTKPLVMIIFDGENGSIQVSDVQSFVIEFTDNKWWFGRFLVTESSSKLGYGIWVWN